MSVYHVSAWCPLRTEEGAGSLETRVVDPCELPCDAGNQTLWTSSHCSQAQNHLSSQIPNFFQFQGFPK